MIGNALTGWAKLRGTFYVVLFVSALVALLQMAGIATVENNVLIIRINIEGWFNPAYVTAFVSIAGPFVASIAVALGLKSRAGS